MQAGKSAMGSAKETVANIGATAKSGMDKTKATLEEKVEKVTSSHPAEKEMAEHKKELKIQEAEVRKREAKEHNAAAKEHTRAGHGGLGTETGHQTRTAASPVPGTDYLEEGTVESRPIGVGTGTGRPEMARNPYAESTEPALRGTGGRYT